MTAGGKERRLTELMKALSKNSDINFELVVMSDEIHYKEIFDLGIKIHYLVRGTKKDITVFRKFYQVCKTFRPGIVHCWDSMTAVYAVPACRLLKIKLVNGMVVDTPVTRNFTNKHWLRARLIFPFADIIIGNSKAGLKAYGASEKNSRCIYNGMDLQRFKNLGDTSGLRKKLLGPGEATFFVVGMVAAFEERKDYDTLVKAAVKMLNKHDHLRFMLVGDGTDLETIKALVPENMQNKILFLGKRSDVEMLVNCFDVGVLLTNTAVHGEGISNSIIEYMALQKPVLATRGGGTNEVVIDGYNGYLLDTGRGEQLIEKLEKLMGNAGLRETMGKNGLQMVHENFDIREMTSQYVDAYHKLLNEK